MNYFESKNNIVPEKGDLLLSEPFLPDPNFERSVILLCEHNEQGAFGFVLNKTTLLSISDVIEGCGEFNEQLFMGGPVQQDTLHFIHRYGKVLEDCIPIGNGLYWGGDFDQLVTLISTGSVSHADFRFFLGYSGWESGQLMHEIEEKSWIVYKGAGARQIFESDHESLWRDVLRDMGGRYRMFSNYPTDPRLN